MPIAKNKSEQIPRTESAVQVYTDNYKGNTVDTSKTLITSLRQYVSGMSMIVNYYSQLLSETNIPRPFSLNDIPAHQQYELVKELELKVTSELDSTQNQDNTFTITGSAVIYAGIDPPNQYDVFTTDIGDGREGLFSITEVKRNTMLSASVFDIEYTLLAIMDSTYQANLDLKTVRTFVFLKEFLTLGQNPLITEDDLVNYREAQEQCHALANALTTRFFSKKFSTFLVPQQEDFTYDHFYVNAILNLAFFEELTSLLNVRTYGVYDLHFDEEQTLWNAIFTLDFGALENGFKKAGIISSNTWSNNPTLKSIYFTNIGYVLAPKERVYNVDDDHNANECLLAEDDLKGDDDFDWNSIPEGSEVATAPLIFPVTVDDYYVLSESFYTADKNNMSILEAQLQNAMTGDTVDYTLVMKLAANWREWPKLEQFYYGPIICVLLTYLANTIGRYHVN